LFLGVDASTEPINEVVGRLAVAQVRLDHPR
jgi:hypothetical protein